MIYAVICCVIYFTPIAIHFGTRIYKKTKVKKETIKNLENLGYDVDRYYISKIFNFFKDEDEKNKYNIDKNYDSCYYIPFFNWLFTIFNLEYFFGDHTSEPWWDNFSKMNDDKIKWLIKEDVISENKEKMQFLKDKNNAIKELEKKYDDTSQVKSNDVVIISENDSMNELYEKLEVLQEMILRKQSNSYENNNVLKYENKEVREK